MPTASAAQKRKLSPDSEIDLRQSAERIDTHVGMRFRLRRQELGMSQTAVADELGVTFQQVQKYERGINRISASRLHDLCGILSIPVEYFFDGLEDDISEPEGPDLSDPELIELVDAYMGIPRQMTRARLSAMLRSVARWVEE